MADLYTSAGLAKAIENESNIANNQTSITDLQNSKLDKSSAGAGLYFYPTTADSEISGFKKLVKDKTEDGYNITPVSVQTPTITGNDILVFEGISSSDVLRGSIGTIDITTAGQVRNVSGGEANFYFTLSKRDSLGNEVLFATSEMTVAIDSSLYVPLSAIAHTNDVEFASDGSDRVVIRWYANKVSAPDPVFEIQLGGNNPVRISFPAPTTSIVLNIADIVERIGSEVPDMNFLTDDEKAEVAKLVSDTQGARDNLGIYSKTEVDNLLGGLGKLITVADLTERNALADLVVGTFVTVEDDGDGKWARYEVTATTDGTGANSTFEKRMDNDILINALSSADIRTALENASDSNILTDVLLAKLNSLTENTLTTIETAELNSNVKTIYEANADTNAFNDANKDKLENKVARGYPHSFVESSSVITNGKDFTVPFSPVDYDPAYTIVCEIYENAGTEQSPVLDGANPTDVSKKRARLLSGNQFELIATDETLNGKMVLILSTIQKPMV